MITADDFRSSLDEADQSFTLFVKWILADLTQQDEPENTIPEPILEEEPVQHHTSQVFFNALCSRIHRG